MIGDDDEWDEDESNENQLAKSIAKDGAYIRASGKCKSNRCNKRAAPHQVYCSRDCSPYGLLIGDGPLGDRKQIYKKRPRRKK